MKRELKRGDKIRFTGALFFFETGRGAYFSGNPMRATVLSINGSRLEVRPYGFGSEQVVGTGYIDRRQVVKVFVPRKKAEKPERVELWTHRQEFQRIPPLNTGYPLISRGELEGDEYAHLLEIRPGEIPISQKDLWTALRTKHGIPRPTCHEILDQLGFPKEAQ